MICSFLALWTALALPLPQVKTISAAMFPYKYWVIVLQRCLGLGVKFQQHRHH